MFVIGIAGGTGSGKTTVVEQLLRSSLSAHVSLLPHDAYYFDGDRMPEHVRSIHNWDHPDALDNELFVAHVDQLLAGRPLERPVYDFCVHARSGNTVRVEPRPVLLLEGILLLAVPEVRWRMHLKVFVDTPADLRVVRRMLRDTRERGRTVESVAEQYRETVRPMHEQFVEPSRAFANVVIPWEDHNPPAVWGLLAMMREAVASAGLPPSFPNTIR